MRAALFAALVVPLLLGCGDDLPPGPARDAGAEASDSATLPDAQGFCPSLTDPAVHYVHQDYTLCADTVLDCTTDQYGFDNVCGCGCIDKGDPSCPPPTDSNIDWISRDPADCPAEPASCMLNQVFFTNTCGCGCLTPGG